MFIQVFTQKMFQHRQLDAAVGTRNTDRSHKISNRLRRISTAAEARKRRHAWIVPATNVAFFDELAQFALAHHGVSQAQAVEFNLLRRKNIELLDEPTIDRLMV